MRYMHVISMILAGVVCFVQAAFAETRVTYKSAKSTGTFCFHFLSPTQTFVDVGPSSINIRRVSNVDSIVVCDVGLHFHEFGFVCPPQNVGSRLVRVAKHDLYTVEVYW